MDNKNISGTTNKPTSTTGVSTNKSESLRDRVGEALEKVGHVISEKGAPSIGQKIHDMGDKLEEHHKDPNHPHDV